MLKLEQIMAAVADIAEEFQIKNVILFGSYANGTSTSESDVDLLIEFNSPVVSLLTLAELKNRIEDILQTEVDVVHAPLPTDSMIEIEKGIQIYAA